MPTYKEILDWRLEGQRRSLFEVSSVRARPYLFGRREVPILVSRAISDTVIFNAAQDYLLIVHKTDDVLHAAVVHTHEGQWDTETPFTFVSRPMPDTVEELLTWARMVEGMLT